MDDMVQFRVDPQLVEAVAEELHTEMVDLTEVATTDGRSTKWSEVGENVRQLWRFMAKRSIARTLHAVVKMPKATGDLVKDRALMTGALLEHCLEMVPVSETSQVSGLCILAVGTADDQKVWLSQSSTSPRVSPEQWATFLRSAAQQMDGVAARTDPEVG